MDFERYVVGAVQLYSDKPQILLSAGALSSYSFHDTLPNLTERAWRAYINNEYTVVSYSPVNNTIVEKNGFSLEKRKFGRTEILHATQNHQKYFRTLRDFSFVRLFCKDVRSLKTGYASICCFIRGGLL